MTNYIVDADTAAFGERVFVAGVAETSRRVSVIERVVMDQFVQLTGRHTLVHMRPDKIENLSIKPPRLTHLFLLCLIQAILSFSTDHYMRQRLDVMERLKLHRLARNQTDKSVAIIAALGPIETAIFTVRPEQQFNKDYRKDYRINQPACGPVRVFRTR